MATPCSAPQRIKLQAAATDTGHEENNHGVDAGARQPPPRAAERDIQIARKETGHGDAPVLPQVRDIARAVGGIEVHGQFNVEAQRHAGRHVAVAGKVKVKLQAVCKDGNQRRRGVQAFKVCPAPVGGFSERVRNQNLFEQTECRTRSSRATGCAQTVCVCGRPESAAEFRSGTQFLTRSSHRGNTRTARIRKENSSRVAPAGVDEVRNLLEGEKADAKRQKQMNRVIGSPQKQ